MGARATAATRSKYAVGLKAWPAPSSVDHQVVDDRIFGQCGQPRLEILCWQPRQVGDLESRFERLQLYPRCALVLLAGLARVADDEDAPNVGLQRHGQSERSGEVQLGDHSSRVREAASERSEREVHDRCVGKQLVAILVDELDGGGLYGDDEVDPLSFVFHAQELTEGRLIRGVRKPPLVEVFGIMEVQVVSQTLFEQSRQLTVTRDGYVPISTGRVQDEHLFRAGPRGLDWPDHADRQRDQQATNEWNVLARRPHTSKNDLGGDLEKPWRQDRQRLQPGSARDERVVVRQHRTRVERVVDVERDQRS